MDPHVNNGRHLDGFIVKRLSQLSKRGRSDEPTELEVQVETWLVRLDPLRRGSVKSVC